MRRSWLNPLCLAGLVIALVSALPAVASAQNAIIRGTVRSEGGDPVVGANVYFVELNLQAATNDAGRFVITVPGERVRGQQLQLRVRAIGYRPSSRAVTIAAGEQTVDYTLAQDINRLEELVVTGVLEGTEQTRVPFTVSRVDVADVPVPSVDPLRLLAGRVPGANIMSSSGRPGRQPDVILRGPTSINATGRGQGPLYIVDGVIINGGLPDINPADIENVEVVKGAAAASLYGARAGQGVIQITTRSGRRSADGMSFNLRSEVGASDIEGEFLLARSHALFMDARNQRFCISVTGQPICARSVDWNTEAARVNNEPGDFALTPAGFTVDPGASTAIGPLRHLFLASPFPGPRLYNAVDQVTTAQAFNQNTFDMTGRFNQTQVYASVSSLRQAGSIRYLDGFERYTARLNVDQQIGTAWRVALRTFYSRNYQDGFTQEGGGAAFFRLTRQPAQANLLARDTLGRLYVRSNLMGQGQQNENPLVSLAYRTDEQWTDRFIGGITLRYQPVNWIDVEGQFSLDFRSQIYDFYQDKGYRTTVSAFTGYVGSVQKDHDDAIGINTSLNVTLRRNFGRDLATRWSLRYLYEQQDTRFRQGGGNTLSLVGVPQTQNATVGIFTSSSNTSVRQIGLFAGVNLEYRERYIVDALIRRDGSSLFGSANRWATWGRGSLAWRMSQEGWWFGGDAINEFKIRASRGSAGGRPNFSAQYETWGASAAGPTFGNLGNINLRPERTIENEFGADLELFRRVGVNLTYAHSETRDQLLLVPNPVERGFGNQWQNAGTMENKTWELSVNVPLVTRRDLSWSWRFTYDRTRTVITELAVPPFNYGATLQATTTIFQANVGQRYATIYGRRFITSCAELPPAFQSQCGGAGSQFQINDEGFVVWTGGYNWNEGITRNLWGTSLAGASAPWGVALNWGAPIILRDTACITTPSASCAGQNIPLGVGLPDWQFSVSTNFQWRRLSVYALLQGSMGREVWNQGRHWSHLDFITAAVDQRGRTVETAKPIGYYWRAAPPDAAGYGGFYDFLAPNSYFVETASYAKLRELMVAYNIGPVGGVGNWTISLVGRNLYTFSDYLGFDPEVGVGGGIASSAAINATDSFTFPNTRSFTIGLSTSF